MDDLISRSALLAAYDKAHQGPPGGARKLIENAPDAIVRCKDCKYWTDVRGGVCKRLAIYVVEDWFCGNAEKRSIQETANRKKNKASNGT